MAQTPIKFSDDQAEAFDSISKILKSAGVNLDDALLTPLSDGNPVSQP